MALSGFEPGLIAHFSFDRNADTLIDITGNGNDGIINGGDWVGGVLVNAPEFPEPEIIAQVEVSGNNVTFDFEADTAGLGYFDFAWELNDYGRVMSYESVSAQALDQVYIIKSSL